MPFTVVILKRGRQSYVTANKRCGEGRVTNICISLGAVGRDVARRYSRSKDGLCRMSGGRGNSHLNE